MRCELVIAGAGGQGVMLAGQLLAQAAIREGKHASYMPSYGPEMRGGSASCRVVVSIDWIDCPLTDQPAAALLFNAPSFRRFEGEVTDGGWIIYNASLVEWTPSRKNVKYVGVPMTELARCLGNDRLANMIGLGAYCRLTAAVSLVSLEEALDDTVSARHKALLGLNRAALRQGYEVVGPLVQRKCRG